MSTARLRALRLAPVIGRRSALDVPAGRSCPAPDRPAGSGGTELGGTGSGTDAAQVSPVAGVDLDLLAGGHEQRHLDLRAGLQSGRLGAAGRPVALQARVGVLDDQLDR